MYSTHKKSNYQKANLNISIINVEGDGDEMHKDKGLYLPKQRGKWLFWGFVTNSFKSEGI